MKKINSLLAAFTLIGCVAFAQKPVLNISLKAYIEKKTVAYYGGLAAIQDSINLQFQKINAAYNAETRFTHTYNYTVGAFQVYDNSAQFYQNGKLIDSSRYLQYIRPEEGNNVLRIVYDAFPREGSVAVNWNQTINVFLRQNRDGLGSMFSDRFNNSMVHEFGHVRGQLDLYNGKVSTEKNRLLPIRYENGYNSIMNNCYNEVGFDPITIAVLNRTASLYGSAYVTSANGVAVQQAFFPNTINIRVKDALGNPVNNAQVKMYGALSYLDSKEDSVFSNVPKIITNTNAAGQVSFVGAAQNPFDFYGDINGRSTKYATFYITVTSNGQTRAAWLSHIELMHAKATGNDNYTLDIALPAGSTQPANVAPITAYGIAGGQEIYTNFNNFVGISVADPDGDVNNATVKVFKNGSYVGNATINPVTKLFWYEIKDNTTAGEFTYSVEIRDEKGALSPYTDVTKYRVYTPAQAIQVAIASPVNNASFPAGTTVPLKARYSSKVKTIAKIDYFSGATLLGSSNTVPFEFNWSPSVQGNYAITAVAYDSVWNTKTSAPINVSITAPLDCPEPQYVAGTAYATNTTVKNKGKKYQCNVGGWCSSAAAWAYEPGVGSAWTSAWTETGICAAVNPAPTIAITSPTEGQVLSVAAGQKINYTVATTPAIVDSVKYILVDVVCNGPGCTNVRRFTRTAAPYSLSVDPVAGATSSQVNVIAFKNGIGSAVNPTVNYTVVQPVKPVVTITAPLQNAIFYQYPSDGNLTKIDLSFNIATSLIDSVRYSIVETICDGPGCTLLKNVTVKTAPFSYSYLPALKFNGYTQVQVFAFSKGLVSDAVSAVYYVKPLPEVSIVTPVDQSVVSRTATNIPVTVNVNTANLAIDSVVYIVTDAVVNGQFGSTTERRFRVTAPYNLNLPVLAGKTFTRIAALAFGDGGKNSKFVSTQVNYNDAPVVTITAPTVGSKFNVGGSVTVSANVTDEGTVAKVEIYSPHIANSTVTLTAAPYTATFSNLLSSGNRFLTTFIVKATDNQGAVTVQTIDVAENRLPVIAVTSPVAVNGINPKYLVGGAITVSANVTDQDGTISKVEITRGTTNTGLVTLTAAPYTTTYNNLPAPQPDGSYSFTVKAFDNNGGVSTQLVVVYKNRVPTTTITSPAAGATFNTNSNIVIGALPFDPDFTSGKIEYFNGATKLGEVVVNGLLSGTAYNFTWLNVANGNYTITAKTTDDLGESGVSAPVTLTVRTPTATCTAPTWSASTAYNGGQFVQYNGIKYTANWWTSNERPDLNNGPVGTGKPWTSNGTCTARIENVVAKDFTTIIYPNPSNGTFTIVSEVETKAVVYSQIGVTIATINLEVGQNAVSLALASGIYYVNIDNQVTKLVIE